MLVCCIIWLQVVSTYDFLANDGMHHIPEPKQLGRQVQYLKLHLGGGSAAAAAGDEESEAGLFRGAPVGDRSRGRLAVHARQDAHGLAQGRPDLHRMRECA